MALCGHRESTKIGGGRLPPRRAEPVQHPWTGLGAGARLASSSTPRDQHQPGREEHPRLFTDKDTSRRQPARHLGSEGDLTVTNGPPIDTGALLLRARLGPEFLTPHEVQHLQRAVGNQAVGQLLRGHRPGWPTGDGRSGSTAQGANGPVPIQRRGGQGNQGGPQTGMFAGLGRIPEPLRPIVQAILAAVMEGLCWPKSTSVPVWGAG